jgi:hypothetical protein
MYGILSARIFLVVGGDSGNFIGSYLEYFLMECQEKFVVNLAVLGIRVGGKKEPPKNLTADILTPPPSSIGAIEVVLGVFILCLGIKIGASVEPRVSYIDVVSGRAIEINGYHYICKGIYEDKQKTKDIVSGFTE